MIRPTNYNKVIIENDVVYAGYTKLSDKWMGALFTKTRLKKGDVIAEYTGKIYSTSESHKIQNQEYMMSARNPSDLRQRNVIDGNPNLYADNIAGYANFAQGKHANAVFDDRASERPTRKLSHVFLIANEVIPSGVEVRVDYDGGSNTHPFRDQLLKNGVLISELKNSKYKSVSWNYPPKSINTKKTSVKKNAFEIVKRPRGRPPQGKTWNCVTGVYE